MYKGACSNPQRHPQSFQTYRDLPEIESYLEGFICVKFHAQNICSLLVMSGKPLSEIRKRGQNTYLPKILEQAPLKQYILRNFFFFNLG